MRERWRRAERDYFNAPSRENLISLHRALSRVGRGSEVFNYLKLLNIALIEEGIPAYYPVEFIRQLCLDIIDLCDAERTYYWSDGSHQIIRPPSRCWIGNYDGEKIVIVTHKIWEEPTRITITTPQIRIMIGRPNRDAKKVSIHSGGKMWESGYPTAFAVPHIPSAQPWAYDAQHLLEYLPTLP